jgi:hypothetical protein
VSKELTTLKKGERVQLALESLIKDKLEPGTLLPFSKLEELLGVSRDTKAFSFLISELRHCLYSAGKYLSGEGSEEKQAYEILDGRDHQWIAKLAMAKAERSLNGMQTLLVNTDTGSMSKLEKERHAATLREVAMKNKIIQRSSEVEQIVFRHNPQLLEN